MGEGKTYIVAEEYNPDFDYSAGNVLSLSPRASYQFDNKGIKYSVLSDYLGEELDFSKLRNKLIVVFYASLGLVVPVFGGRPVLVMIASQTFTLIVTPLVIILTLILLNKRSLMGENKAGLGMNVMLAIIAVFTIVMSFIGAEALLGVIS